MEDMTFDQFVRECLGATTRRNLVRGLAAIVGTGGAGLALGTDVEAGKNKKKKRRKQKRREAEKECGANGKTCETPLNPCATVECQKGKCIEGTKSDQTVCGDGLVCVAGACVCADGVCTVRVSSGNLSGWLGYNDGNDTVNNAVLDFVAGPGDPPYGPGSVEIVTPAGARYNLATYQFAGTRLKDLTTLKFTTFNASDSNAGSDSNSGYLHFNVDFYGSDTWQRRLVYVPSQNGTILQDEWQEWNAIAGNAKWLWSNFAQPWPGGGSQLGEVPKTWSQILAEYPDARFRLTDAFFGIRVGEPYATEYTENIDSITFGTQAGTTRFVFGPSS